MFKKPTLVETPLTPTPPEALSEIVHTAVDAKRNLEFSEKQFPPMAPFREAAGAIVPEAVPPSLAELMLELEMIGEVFKKRKIFSTQSMKFEGGKFRLTCSWQPEKDNPEIKRYIGRPISSSLTAKGLTMVIDELKSGVGI